MSPHDLLELLRTRPFVPFRLHTTDGQSYDIRHPDQALVLKTRVILPAPSGNGIPDRSEHVALVHVVRIEEMPPASASSESTPRGA